MLDPLPSLAVRRKAHLYLAEMRVRITAADPYGAVDALVRGSSPTPYWVLRDRDGNWTCSCPARGDRCSHIVATAMLVDTDSAPWSAVPGPDPLPSDPAAREAALTEARFALRGAMASLSAALADEASMARDLSVMVRNQDADFLGRAADIGQAAWDREEAWETVTEILQRITSLSAADFYRAS